MAPTDPRLSDWFDRYRRPLVAYAAKMLGGDWAAAHDVTQETFLRLCRTDIDKVENRIAAWLFSVCRTRVIDLRRTGHESTLDPSDLLAADPRQPPPDGDLLAAESRQTLAEQIDTLSPRQQEVVRLRFSGGLSYAEIAEVTGMTTGNVGFHLHAAIKQLRQLTIQDSPGQQQPDQQQPV